MAAAGPHRREGPLGPAGGPGAQLPGVHAGPCTARRGHRWLLGHVGGHRHAPGSLPPGAPRTGDRQRRQRACHGHCCTDGQLLRRHHRLARRILLAGAGGRSGPVVENRRVATDEGDRRARFVECVRAVEAPAGGVGHGGREPVLHGPVLAVHLPAAVRGSHAARIAFNVVAVAAVDGRCGPGRHGVDRALRAQGNVPHAGAAASADGPGGCVHDPHRQHAAEGGDRKRVV
ncbi:hypothetical protein G6F63_013906 [Rhizopus arrhizus]|nr:hypothetical protein G6F63_013906 [Rhizopus arrhizus]